MEDEWHVEKNEESNQFCDAHKNLLSHTFLKEKMTEWNLIWRRRMHAEVVWVMFDMYEWLYLRNIAHGSDNESRFAWGRQRNNIKVKTTSSNLVWIIFWERGGGGLL